MSISEAGQQLVVALRKNQPFRSYPDGTERQPKKEEAIRGEIIRKVLLAEPILPDEEGTPLAVPHGINLSGLWIEGDLDLSDLAGGEQQYLPAIVIENCLIEGEAKFDNSRILRLSLSGCAVNGVSGKYMNVSGSVDLSNLRSADESLQREPRGCKRDGEQQGQCEVDFRGAHIGGDFKCSEAKLCVRPRQEGETFDGGGRPWALNLGGAEIDGEILLQPGFRAWGGISISNAKIGDNLWANSAEIDSEWSAESLKAAQVEVRGGIYLGKLGDGPPFRSTGLLLFYAAELSELAISDAELNRHSAFRSNKLEARHVIACHLTNVDREFKLFDISSDRGNIYLARSEFGNIVMGRSSTSVSNFESINMSGTRVKNDVSISGLSVETIISNRLRLGGDLELNVTTRGELNFRAARIGNRVILRRIEFDNTQGSHPRLILDAAAAEIGLEVEKIEIKERERDKDALTEFRYIDVSFYPGWKLIEALVKDERGPAVRAFLWNGKEELVQLNGESPPIHMMNARNRLDIGSEDKARRYLQFFCAHVWGDEGSFRIVNDVKEVDQKMKDEEVKAKVKDCLGGKVIGQPTNLKSWRFKAPVAYADALFIATFRIDESGMVEMEEDEPVFGDYGRKYVFDKPLRIRRKEDKTESARWDIAPSLEGTWNSGENSDKSLAKTVNNKLGISAPKNTHRPEVSLMAFQTGYLSDNSARAWFHNYEEPKWEKEIKVRLAGFRYQMIFDKPIGPLAQFNRQIAVEEAWESRQKWLALQYGQERTPQNGKPLKIDEFDPEPYENLRQFYQKSGKYRDAVNLRAHVAETELKLRAREHRHQFLRFKSYYSIAWIVIFLLAAYTLLNDWALFGSAFLTSGVVFAGSALAFFWAPTLFRWFYRFGFKYGLSWTHAVRTFVACLLLGWGGFTVANHGTLAIPRLSVAGYVLKEPTPIISIDPVLELQVSPTQEMRSLGRITGLLDPSVPQDKETSDLLISVPCGNVISPGLYAVDVFIPLLDLREETLCSIKEEATLARWLKSLYAILGWIVTSLTILTIAGVIKRRSE